MCAESPSGETVTVVTMHGRVISSLSVKSSILSAPVRILRPGIRVVVGGTSTGSVGLFQTTVTRATVTGIDRLTAHNGTDHAGDDAASASARQFERLGVVPSHVTVTFED